ncbi:16S rRNA (guanine(527)-N(7))-methyltransferase RsmG [Parerythrobacter lacustris]|uniref:Ribosomal RNA small subunit methyltransferase G n=1 Tax=Parerythrobacter lacustris TaxID=2969984 RepID=A0ABT1XS32_9SPHN|nr:16S rRNA (guanine(527)-N(7))-methyltransferase RsmG [Parerythrobacter lacustris]MCR2834458.1 16S rRNA (guanine(527)-N(7))-methyltransferase RsmG [Parerythrobacter lacustris]
MERLDRFVALLLEENTRQNLISRPTEAIVWQRHIADSAQLLALAPEGKAGDGPWLDLGSGPGMPGIVVAAMRPDMPVVLVESRRKRFAWLGAMVEALGLVNCRVEGSKLELVTTFHAGTISARAFAPLRRILDLSARFSTTDTLWLLPKGRSAAQEVEELPKRLKQMFHVKQSVTDVEAGIVVGHLTKTALVRLDGGKA